MKKKLIAFLLTVALVLCCIPNSVQAQDITPTFYGIRTVEDLYNIRNNMSGNYMLLNDIDLTDATSKGGEFDFNGHGWNPIGSNDKYEDIAFTGVFDGCGHTIKGLRMNVESFSSENIVAHLGLFANNNGIIKNINFENVDIYTYLKMTASYQCNIMLCSVVAAKNTGTISGITTTGKMVSDMAEVNWGDVCCAPMTAYNTGTIYRCINHADINVNVIAEKYPHHSAGRACGIAVTSLAEPTSTIMHGEDGIDYYNVALYTSVSGVISECANTGNVEKKNGENYGAYGIADGNQVLNCYSTGRATDYGLANWGTVENCYFTHDANYGGNPSKISNSYRLSMDGSTVNGYISLSEEQMHDQNSYVGFDFENVWVMDAESGYPYPQLRHAGNSILNVSQIEIVSEPTNEFYEGTELVYEGAVARVYWEDGTKTDVILTPGNTVGGTTDTPGKKTVVFTCGGISASFEISVSPSIIESLIVKELPSKTDYIEGQSFDRSGLIIYKKYNSGSEVECNDYSISDVDPSIIGKQTVTVSYNGKSTSFDVNYIAKTMTDLKITANPTKTVYDEGEAFNSAGMIVTAYYNDDTSVNVTDYTIGDMTGYGAVKLPITYGGFTVNVDVTIRKLVKSVSFNQESFELYEGKSAKLAVTVDPEDADNNELVWTSGDTNIATVGSDGTVTAVTEGNTVITAKVKEDPSINTACNITVLKVKPETLIIKSLPDKTVYLEGEEFDSSGLSVSVINNDKSEETNVEFTLSKPDTTPGKKTVMVFAGGVSSSFEIEYIEKKVTGIRIESEPSKTEYLEGEEFDPTGLVVMAACEGGFELEVTDYTITGFNGTGQLSLSIGYAGKSAQLSVTVYGITGIEVSRKPDKLVYYEGETFDKTGLVVKKVYSNGYSEEIKDYTIGNMTGGGTVAIAVNYKNYKTSFNVTVKVLGGMKELMNALQSGNVSSGNLQITKETNRVLFTYTKNGAEGYYISSQILKWYLYTDGTKSRQEYQIVTHDKDGNAVTRTFNASVDIKSYYGGTMINYADSKSVKITERYGIEINKLGSLLSAEAVKAWNDLIYDKYYISLEKCGFESFFKKSGTIGKDATETAEVNKLVAYLKNHDNKIAIQIDNGRYYIEYKPESNQLYYHMYYMNDEGTEYISEMSFTYDISSQDHDVELEYWSWKDKLISYKAYVNIALVKFEDAEHIPFISTGNAYPASTNKAYVESVIQQRALSGDLLSPIVFMGFKMILAEKCNVDITKCGINSSTSFFKVGWVTENGKKYYYYEGVKQTGFRTISGKKYYFGSDGAMQTGWQKISNKWYYFKEGVMQTNWQKIGGKWYYFKAGIMVSGWQSVGGKWYFFKADGSMAANEWCKGYWLNKDGTWTYKKKATWRKDKTGWWYGCTGWYAKNQWQKIDGKWYYFDKKGYIVTGTRKIGSKTYRFNSSGVCLNP